MNWCALVIALAIPSMAFADEPSPDVVRPQTPNLPDGYQRSWLYVDEPSTPTPFRPAFQFRTTYTGSGYSPTRPFAGNTASVGVTGELGVELSFLQWLAFRGSAMVGGMGTDSAGFGATAGVHLVTPRFARTQIALTSGYLREIAGDSGIFGRVSVTHDIGRARLGTTLHLEHVFGNKVEPDGDTLPRDAVDIMVSIGASYRVYGPLRVGIEYTGQDFEGIWDKYEAEGGYRHFLATPISFEAFNRRLSVALGPALGLSEPSPRLVARAAITYSY